MQDPREGVLPNMTAVRPHTYETPRSQKPYQGLKVLWRTLAAATDSSTPDRERVLSILCRADGTGELVISS